MLNQLCTFDQRTRIHFELIGPKCFIVEEPSIVFHVEFGRGAQQVGHPVGVNLETRTAQQTEGAPRCSYIVPALI